MNRFILFILAMLLSSSLFANPIKEIIILGDSLSDNGNLYANFKIVPKSPPYFKGRFTNGPTWAEDVGKYFYDKSYIDYKIYAWGGATAILHNPLHDKFIAPITLEVELYQYFLNTLFQDKSHVLYVIWIGANDYLYDEQPDIDVLTQSVVNKIVWTMHALMDQGARYFMIMNLPDLSKTPFAMKSNVGERLHSLTVLHNQKLATAIQGIQQAHADIKIVSINVYNVFNQLLSDTKQFNQDYQVNLTNINESCWKGSVMFKGVNIRQLAKTQDSNTVNHTILNSPSLNIAYATAQLQENGERPCEHAEQYVFWDELHPTQVVHQALAQVVEKSLLESGLEFS